MTEGETALLQTLIDMLPDDKARGSHLTGTRVIEMHDGGMGSLHFMGHGTNRTSCEAVTARSQDEDGVPVEIALNLDQYGKLFELDIWKVDFSPLIRLPEPKQVHRA